VFGVHPEEHGTNMSSHFSRSLRTLDTDNSRRNTIVFTLLVAFLGIWLTWFVGARVAVYASTQTARLEVDRENHPVDAAVGGRVDNVRMRVGQMVRAGDVLVELDANSEQLARSEEQARLAPAAAQLTLLKEELAAHTGALEGERRSKEAAVAQAEADARRARSAASFAAEESARMNELLRRNLISELEASRARNLAMERQTDAESAVFSSQRVSRGHETREQERLAQMARLRREIATIEGTRGETVAASERLGYDIERRTVRAPISGRIAEVTPLTPGAVLAAGHRICTIVPDGALRVVAHFSPAMALGRVRIGQPARVRLEGFPWTQYGSPSARVSNVAGESRDGAIRVELTLDGQAFAVPLQHGLPAEVDVEVERMSPAALVMRSVGVHTRLAAESR
jgi:membrane fusion protein (multidrug efflux system)